MQQAAIDRYPGYCGRVHQGVECPDRATSSKPLVTRLVMPALCITQQMEGLII